MKRFNFLLIGLLLVSIKTAYTQDTLFLSKAIELALENNYSIRISRNNQEIARNSNTLGNAGFLPQVNVNYGNTKNITNSKANFLNGTVIERNDVHNSNQNGSVLANWTIFDGFNMFINKNKLEEMQKAGEYQARMNIENTLSQLVVTYFAVVQQERMLKVIQDAITLSSERKRLASAMKSIGSGSESSYLQASVDVNADTTRYLQQLALIKNTKADLNRILARESKNDFKVNFNLEIKEDLRLEDLNSKVETENAQLLVQRANMNIAEYTIGNYRSQYMPIVGVFGGYNFGKSITPVNQTIQSRSYGPQYGLTASINLFNGGVTTTNLKNARLQYQSSQMVYEDVKLMLQNDLYKNYNNYITNLQLIKIQKGNVETAQKDVNIAVGRYKLGNMTDIDLRVTQLKLIEAENNLLVAEYTAKQSEIELQRISGQLLNTINN